MDAWVSLLIQVPLVGVFIWYSLEMSKRSTESQKTFLDALDRRDSAFEGRNRATIDAISNLNTAICHQLEIIDKSHEEHDKYVRKNMPTVGARSRAKAA